MTVLSGRAPATVAAADVGEQLARGGTELVLVDCFGTLVHRRVPSDRVKQLACTELSAARGGLPGGVELLERRRSLERALNDAASGPGRPRDHRLPALAAALAHDLTGSTSAPGGEGGDAAELVELVCDIELATEARCAEVDRELAESLRRLEVPVWVLSDTNLTDPQLGELLARLGIGDLAARVVTSADAGETKRSGALYELVLADAGLDPARVAMVGDNPVADGRRAEEAGVRSVLVPGGRWDATKRAPAPALRRDVVDRVRDALRADGPEDVFPELALTLWWFTTRLDAALRAMDASGATFLAREGMFLQRLFDHHQRWHAHRGRRPVPSSYLLTSRRSTYLPSLVDAPRQLRALAAGRPELSTTDLAALIQLDEHRLPERSTGAELVERVLASPDLMADLRAGREVQLTLLRRLVDEVAPGEARLHTVDVGWKGTVRDHLALALGSRPVHAHLLGLVSAAPVTHLADKVGHLFANQPERTTYFQVLSHFKELYELLLAAPHGSAASYAEAADGSVAVRLDESEEESRSHRGVVEPLQVRCEQRFRRLLEVLVVDPRHDRWLDDLVARHHARMVYLPTAAELDAVASLVQLENFGGRALKPAGMPVVATTGRGLRRHVGGGGWPPLRMRRAGAGWQRHAYGALKLAQTRTGRLR